MRATPAFFVCFFLSAPAFATGIDALSEEDTTDGLKQALIQGVNAAVDKLAVTNGFLENPKVRIPLPGALQKAAKPMRTLGMSKYADGLIVAMNRAAETAATEARPLMMDAVKKMSVEDAKKILAGADDAATQYFRSNTSEELAQKFLPIVKNATDQVGLAKKYNEFAGKGAKFGLVSEKHVNIESYVTQKTLDGLYTMMAEEERLIRNNPMDQGSKLLQEVFGSLK
ncbi:MAG: DUF4197 domain-containing protein [Pseudomonadota bacterium]|nr:DUF4197 domain-containing protein [Pseudomonadota bacterium]